MAKARSPAYPAISLKEALEKISDIYKSDYQNPIARAVAAAHMGYKGLNGKSLGVLAALSKYGLLEGRGDDTRVSDLAVKIIAHPVGTPERAEAISVAANKPELFQELDARFSGGKSSDQAIRSYLLTQKFIPAAADAAIRTYRETKQLVEGDSGVYPVVEAQPEYQKMEAPHTHSLISPAPSALKEGEPFRMEVFGKHIDLSAHLVTPEQVDELIRRLQFGKLMITPASQIQRPSFIDDLEEIAKEIDGSKTEAQRERETPLKRRV